MAAAPIYVAAAPPTRESSEDGYLILNCQAQPRLQPNLAEVSPNLNFSTPPTHESSEHGYIILNFLTNSI